MSGRGLGEGRSIARVEGPLGATDPTLSIRAIVPRANAASRPRHAPHGAAASRCRALAGEPDPRSGLWPLAGRICPPFPGSKPGAQN